MIQRDFPEVIVIGSGPAGCAAAAMCHNAGLEVLLITHASVPDEITAFSAAPLESIHPGVSSLLEKLGVAGVEHMAARATYSGIHAGTSYTPLGEDENGIWQGFHINREIFDAQLLRQIRLKGVKVSFNESVEGFITDGERVIGIKTSEEELYASCIIDASGKKAIAGKKLKFKRKFFSPPLLCWTGVSGGIASYPFDEQSAHFIPCRDGWAWLAPQPPDQCAWTRLSLKGEKSLLPPDALKAYPIIGKIHFANMRWRKYHPVCREGIVLCGDAAGILDPAAGQGIFNALWSGMVAANTVVSCVRQPAYEAFHLAHYDDWFTQMFDMKVSQLSEYYADHGLNVLSH